MARLLIIGAGPVQVPGIQRAQQMGLTVVAMDGSSAAPGLRIADECCVIDICDVETVVERAKQLRIDGVMCVAVDVAVRTVAAVGEALGLPSPTPAAALNATSKRRMREVWASAGVASAKFAVCRHVDEAAEAARTFGFPAVVKPAENAGSRGVSLVACVSEISGAYAGAREHDRGSEILVEEFMEGVEMSVEALICEGQFHLVATSDKIRTSPPHLLDLAVLFPSAVPCDLKEEATALVERAVTALGVDNAPVHAEVILTPTGPRMVELAARGPGFKVFSEMIPWTSGVDVLEASINIALGSSCELPVPLNRGSVLVFPQAAAGRICRIDGVDDALALPNIKEVELYVGVGDLVHPLRSGSERFGHIISEALTRQEAERAARTAEQLIKIATQ